VANADGSSPVAVTPADQNSARAAWVGKELTLGYEVQKDGEWSYWLAPLQGRPERLNPALDLKKADRLRLSSDGTMLAAHMTTPNGLQVVTGGVRGGAVRVLTPPARNIGFPCWSPDGRWIAAQERLKGDSTLVVVRSTGGEIRTIAKEFTQYYAYDWSPDGDRIVFAGLNHGVWNIYWISVSTAKVEQLTHFTSQSGVVRYPSWSPKGDQILFERNDLTSNIYIADLNSPDK
jgi:Tol biopolymer transport system component